MKIQKYAFIIPINSIGSHISINDSKEHCLISSLNYLQKDGYTILGLKKTACDNIDKNWQDFYTVIGDGGIFAEDFKNTEKRKTRLTTLYVNSAIVNYIDTLSEEEMEKWSKKIESYNDEKPYRYIFAMKKNKKYIFEVSEVAIQTEDDSKTYEKALKKQIHTVHVMTCAYPGEEE